MKRTGSEREDVLMFLKEKISREKMRQPSKSFTIKSKMNVNL